MWSAQLPNDIDVVIGIPRSGIIPATMLALHRNILTGNLQSIINNTFETGYSRLAKIDHQPKKIFVLDDTINNGKTIIKTKALLEEYTKDVEVIYGAVYASEHGKHLVDSFYKILPKPRAFAWNIFHGALLSQACVDIDGVLCVDPTKDENDDGHCYINFLKNAKLLVSPTNSIKTIVTSRLEKYRSLTEEWLKNNDIQYNQLIMSPYDTQKARRKARDHGKRKGNFYKNDKKASIFIESSYRQAQEIYKISGKPVLCTENMLLIGQQL